MKIYLDNCCFNRPFDDQSQIRIRLETEAKLYIQKKILDKQIELVWSYILDYENEFNPFEERKNVIRKWKNHANLNITETKEIIDKAKQLLKYGIKSKDALHLSCAVCNNCDYFITTDDFLIQNLLNYEEIKVINPLTFISIMVN